VKRTCKIRGNVHVTLSDKAEFALLSQEKKVNQGRY